MKSTVSTSARASTTPAPPGTQIRLSEGELSNVQVGRMLRPRSLETGCRVLATTWVLDCGNLLGTETEGGVARRLNISNGPVKSNCVIPGKITKPTSKSNMSPGSPNVSFADLAQRRQSRLES